MSLPGLLSWGLALAGAWLLAAAGLGHLRHRTWLRAVLAAQKLLPPRLRPAVVRLLGPGEVALAAATAAALVAGLAAPLRACTLLLGTTYLGFAGHTVVLLRRRPGAPCGCFGDDEPASALVVVRALVLAGAALACLRCPPPPGPAWRLLVTAAGAVLALALWLVPRRARPTR